MQTFTILASLLVLSGCSKFNNIAHNPQTELKLMCSKKCTTIASATNSKHLSKYNKARINHFLKKQSRKKTVMLSNCVDKHQVQLTNQVFRYIKYKGYKATIVRRTIPFNQSPIACVNLIRGKVKIKLPDCSKKYVLGCATQYNFRKLIRNPNDLLILSGINGNID